MEIFDCGKFAFDEHRRSKRATEDGASVEVDPVQANVGLAGADWSMAVHNETVMVCGGRQKRLTTPQ
ncbi:hypothetical protein [Pseudolabrys taiwanensis]|uniref:hypothetical protein n=1 Tax=Pseudolabrys taiwanensis TaxID=331696 RepID=UPI0013B408BD|nr:hypothetical protein [Pseudolabrys taiwanensis]